MQAAIAMSVVGIANTNEDIIELLRVALEQEGFATALVYLPDVKKGRSDFNEFLGRHDPDVIVFDIPPPYDDNWTFVATLRQLPTMKGRGVVITTTHKLHLEKLVGPTDAVEIVGKPNDTSEVVQAVKREMEKKARP
jgi:CheY-like chemotaxis protein